MARIRQIGEGGDGKAADGWSVSACIGFIYKFMSTLMQYSSALAISDEEERKGWKGVWRNRGTKGWSGYKKSSLYYG